MSKMHYFSNTFSKIACADGSAPQYWWPDVSRLAF